MMSNDSDVYEQLLAKSLAIFKRNTIPFMLMGVIGIIALVTNLIIIFAISVSPIKRKKYFHISLHLAIADALVGIAYVIVTIRRINILRLGQGQVRSVRCTQRSVLWLGGGRSPARNFYVLDHAVQAGEQPPPNIYSCPLLLIELLYFSFRW